MIYRVTYPSGPFLVQGYLGIPDAPFVPPYPAILYCRGGIGRKGMAKTSWIEDFNQRGVLVIAPFYRGTEGGEGVDEFGGADVEDTDSALRLMYALAIVDTTKIAILGFSRGAINAFQTARTASHTPKLILWGGVSDVIATYNERPDLQKTLRRRLQGHPQQSALAYQKRSALYHIPTWSAPTLIVHGTDDVQVAYSHATNLYEALQQASKNVTLLTLVGYGHHLPAAQHQAVMDTMTHWLIHDDLRVDIKRLQSAKLMSSPAKTTT